jgi:hypothetical protein
MEELLLVQRGGGEQIVLGRRGALLLVKLEVGAEERFQRRQLHVGEVRNATRVRAGVGARLLLRGRTRARKAALEAAAAARMLRRAANFVKALLRVERWRLWRRWRCWRRRHGVVSHQPLFGGQDRGRRRCRRLGQVAARVLKIRGGVRRRLRGGVEDVSGRTAGAVRG